MFKKIKKMLGIGLRPDLDCEIWVGESYRNTHMEETVYNKTYLGKMNWNKCGMILNKFLSADEVRIYTSIWPWSKKVWIVILALQDHRDALIYDEKTFKIMMTSLPTRDLEERSLWLSGFGEELQEKASAHDDLIKEIMG